MCVCIYMHACVLSKICVHGISLFYHNHWISLLLYKNNLKLSTVCKVTLVGENVGEFGKGQ